MRSNQTEASKISHCLLLAFIFTGFTCAVSATHPEVIVTPAWVNSVQQFHRKEITARPATYQNKRIVILETGWGKFADAKNYHAGHVPGAVYLNTDELENGSPRWHLKSVNELQAVIGNHGITPG